MHGLHGCIHQIYRRTTNPWSDLSRINKLAISVAACKLELERGERATKLVMHFTRDVPPLLFPSRVYPGRQLAKSDIRSGKLSSALSHLQIELIVRGRQVGCRTSLHDRVMAKQEQQ